jgi:hypothetical protein
LKENIVNDVPFIQTLFVFFEESGKLYRQVDMKSYHHDFKKILQLYYMQRIIDLQVFPLGTTEQLFAELLKE